MSPTLGLVAGIAGLVLILIGMFSGDARAEKVESGYAGFLPRLGAALLDAAVLIPLALAVAWGEAYFRLFNLYYFFPKLIIDLGFHVYLVRRFGGTPGKLLIGLQIRKVDGQSVGYREAFLRYLPSFVLGLLMSLARIQSLYQISDEDYYSLSFLTRQSRLAALAPSWLTFVEALSFVWFCTDVNVFFTNPKRRALHDFLAGTVVVNTIPDELEETPNQPASASP